MKQGVIHIDLSGWSYPEWKGSFYPIAMKSADYLTHYAQSFDITEVNSSFYHLPRISTVEGWPAKVPDNFKLCIKMSKYLTHNLRLHEPEESLQWFFNAVEPAKKRMGPVLLQLPPSLKFDFETADCLFDILKKKYKPYHFAVEARHSSWLQEESLNLMTKYKIAFVIAESGNRFPYAEAVTAQNIYVRFHGAEKLYASSYPDAVLQEFADKFLAWKKAGHTLWVFFNNTMYGHALTNAATLKKMVGY